MSLIEKIQKIIEDDAEINENRYWEIFMRFDDNCNYLLITHISSMNWNNVMFMGDFMDSTKMNPYILILTQKYPIKLYRGSNFIQIHEDVFKARKWKVDRLLNKFLN